ncbi:MAG: DUF1761 domain-containing protein [Novosphingobium sp.]
MGPINWLAVILAANLATAVALVWHGPLFRMGKPMLDGTQRSKRYLTLVLVMLFAALMLGHLYARIGPATLAARPWIYFLQAGGIPIAFIVPALWLAESRHDVPWRDRLIGAAYWVTAYLLMGAVFWVLQ